MITAERAFQIEVTTPQSRERQVFFVGQDSEEAALEVVSKNPALLPEPHFRVVRLLSQSAITEFGIRPGGMFRWI